MKKKIAMLFLAVAAVALVGCGQQATTQKKAPVTATPTASAPATVVTATPTEAPVVAPVTATPTEKVEKTWKIAPTWTPTPTPTRTPEEQAAWEEEQARELAARSFNKPVKLDNTQIKAMSGDAPVVSDAGTIVAKGNVTQKFSLPLGIILQEGKRAVVKVTVKFNSSDDAKIRVYTIANDADSALSDVRMVENPGNTDVYTKTVYVTAKGECDALMIASGSYGATMADVEIVSVVIEPDTRLLLTEANLKAASGDLPEIKDKALNFKGGVTQKTGIFLNEALEVGDTIALTVKGTFNTADDEKFRFYLVQDNTDSALSEVQYVMNPGNTDPFTTTVLLTAKSAANGVFLCSGGWGQKINDITITEIDVVKVKNVDLTTVSKGSGEVPAVEEGVIQIKGAVTQKIGFALDEEFKAGDKIAVVVSGSFNVETDEKFRFYTVQNLQDSAKSDVVYVNRVVKTDDEGNALPFEATSFKETIVLTVKDTCDGLFLCSGGWGQMINDITISSIQWYRAK